MVTMVRNGDDDEEEETPDLAIDILSGHMVDLCVLLLCLFVSSLLLSCPYLSWLKWTIIDRHIS